MSVPAFDADNFVAGDPIDNPYMVLRPGTTFTTRSETEDGLETGTRTITRDTVQILGITCVEVVDTVRLDGELIEKTHGWFSQDKDGNVWYFGEFSQEFEDGKVVGTEGSWKAGVNGALPGIVMLGNPEVGDEYAQEFAPGVAEDRGRVVALNNSAAVPYGTFQHLLVTEDTNPLEPGTSERKYYAPGIGEILTIEAAGNPNELVGIRVFGTAGADSLLGYVGGDVLDGLGGADVARGLQGNDTYIARQPGDRAIELAGQGHDRVNAFVDYVLDANVEDLHLLGEARNGTGNGLANALFGNRHDNTLLGLGGPDDLFGGAGADMLDGGGGNDDLFGNVGNDRLLGQAGRDRLHGGDGADQLNGGADDDRLLGDHGRDFLTGGAGRDIFQFDDGDTGATRASADRIADFSRAQGDLINLQPVDARSDVAGDQGFRFIGNQGFSGHAGELRFVAADSHLFVEGDVNGDRVADLVIQVDGPAQLVATDFAV